MTYTLSHEQARALMLFKDCPDHNRASAYMTAAEFINLQEAYTILCPAYLGDGSTARSRPVSTSLKVIDRNPGHVTASLFVGRTAGARGNSGQIVLRADEFDELIASGWVDEVVGDE